MSNGLGPPSLQAASSLFSSDNHGLRSDHNRQASVKGASAKTQMDEAPPSRHLWVGNVAHDVSEVQIAEKFVQFGELESATVYPQRSYAFVNFKNERDAVNAKNKLQGIIMGGQHIRIEFAKGAKPSRHLRVSGICPTVRKEQIEAELRKFGLVEDLSFMNDRRSALVHFAKLDDAAAAVEALNGKRFGNEELRVDFGRSQSTKESKDDRLGGVNLGHLGHSELFRGPLDSLRNHGDGSGRIETFQGGLATRSNLLSFGGGKPSKDEDPSPILWVGFSLQTKVDEDRLIRAFIPYGEIERVKTFPGRTYAFVEFRTVEEAIRAKNALEGRLFNDPKVSIKFSNSEIGPVDNPKAGLLPPPARHESTVFSDGVFKARGILGHRLPPGGDRNVSGNGRPVSPPLRLVPNFPPSGVLGVGGHGMGPSSGFGRGMGRGLGQVSGGLIMSDKTIDTLYEGRVTGSFVHAPGQSMRPGRPFDDDFELPDEDFFNREPKRLRLGGVLPPQLSENPIMSSKFDGQRMMPPSMRHLGPRPESTLAPYVNGPGPRLNSLPLSFDAPRPVSLVPSPGAVGPAPIGVSVAAKRASVSSESRLGIVNEGWKWQGLIAKGGTPVCHARCFPVGKGIDIDLPDVINCTARTDLDMLAKHVYQAGDYGVVFFVPDGDVDVTPYQDFMRYLGEKHRAGVAKLSNGGTLFLVPPSEFSEGVLKVPGNNCLFGVVLKFQQQSTAHLQPPPLQQQQHLPQPQAQAGFPQQISYPEPPPPPQGSAVVARVADHALQQGHANITAGATQQLLPAHLANIPLTPELIASLTALLPKQSSAALPTSLNIGASSVGGSVTAPEGTSGRALSLGPIVSLGNVATSASVIESFPASQNNLPPPSQMWTFSSLDQSGLSRTSFVGQSSGSLTFPPMEPSPRKQPQPPPQPQAQLQPQPPPPHSSAPQHLLQPPKPQSLQSQPHPPLPPFPPPPQQNVQVPSSHLSSSQQLNTAIPPGFGQALSQSLAMGLLPGSTLSQLPGESISGQVFAQQLSSTANSNVSLPLQGFSIPQGQGHLGSQSNGLYAQQLRPPSSATVAPVLPADQLAQLTALLTQRQQQPAQQQAAQVLQQHFQQQQPSASSQPQLQTSDAQSPNMPQSQQQLFSQPLQFSGMPQETQSGWGQVSQGLQQQTQSVVQVQSHGVNWEGALSQSQEHANVGSVEPQQGSSTQDADQESERQKRFQATLHLAAALLQQMQQQPKNAGGTEQL